MPTVDKSGRPVSPPSPGIPRVFVAAITAAFILVLAEAAAVSALGVSDFTNSLTDIAALVASAIATVACARAARRGGQDARGWGLIGLAMLVLTIGAALWTWFGFTRNHVYPFPSVADIFFIGYAIPAAIGLCLFQRRTGLRVTRFRAVLDGLVIAASLFFVSCATVFGPLLQGGETGLWLVTVLCQPLVDYAMVSLVVVLAIRRSAGNRLPWAMMGSGLVVLAIADSLYLCLTLTVEGIEDTAGTTVAVGWVCAFLLVAIATIAPASAAAGKQRGGLTAIAELLPYLPVMIAIIVAATVDVFGQPFLVGTGALVVALVCVRHVVIMMEKNALTSELERRVARRTAELDRERAFIVAALENINVGIIACDADGAITLFNRASREQLGLPDDASLGDLETVLSRDIYTDDGKTLIAIAEQPLLRALRGDEVNAAEIVIASPGAERRLILENSRVIRGIDGTVVGAISAQQEITERKRYEVALGEARNAALEASRMKSEFLATMSHEIRTPMNGVIGLNSLLLDTSLDRSQRQYADGVQSAGETLLALINDILDFSRLEAGKAEIESAPFEPRLVIEDVAALVAQSAQLKGLELVAYCMPNVPPMQGDEARIRQLLLHLVSNAVKFTDTGKVVIRACVEDPSGAANVGDVVQLRLEVRDTGIGIAPADTERLFDSFSQADASITRKYGGTGLGLAISRRLADAMGGEIGFESDPGQGSLFWLTLPLAVVNQPEVPTFLTPAVLPKPVAHSELSGTLTDVSHHSPVALPRPEVARPSMRKPQWLGRVLIVEDNHLNQLVAEGIVTKLGYQADLVSNGLLALQAVAKTAYSAVLMDCHMPEMDGFQAASEIRRREATDRHSQRTPIIAMTAGGMSNDRDNSLAAGMDDYLAKPVDIETVQQVLARWIPGQRKARDRTASTTGTSRRATESGPVDESGAAVDLAILSALIEGLNGDDVTRAQFVDAFLFEAERRIPVLLEAADAGDANAFVGAAHALKSSAAWLGALRLARLLSDAEQQGRERPGDLGGATAAIQAEYRRVVVILASMSGSGTPALKDRAS